MAASPTVLVAGAARGGRAAWTFISLALRRAGARPRRTTPRSPSRIDADALVLSGGADVDPSLFGAAAPPAALDLDTQRDRLELRLLDHAWQRNIPVLGICRGAQLLNVYRGGTLDLHVNQTRRTARPVKDVIVAAGTHLRRVLGRARLKVNNMHRHVIRQPGAGLRVASRDQSGRIQAIEARRRFAIGVQWHPEYLVSRRENQRLFHALAAAAASPRGHLPRSQS